MDLNVLMSNSLRFLCVDAINKANSGHPGMPLGMADVATVLFSKFLKFNPKDPKWFDRDRFILSAGHGSMLLYSLLYLTGYEDITLSDIQNFRQLGAKTAGHPEYGMLKGIDMTTGPLGQGIASAVGMALAERIVGSKFGDELCNHFTYVMAGDGCLMEGICEEAASIAGYLKLNKLIVFWDNNNITIDGTVEAASVTDQKKRFEAMGWNVISINGHDFREIENAIIKAQNSDKPTLISCKTTIGFGSPNKAGTPKCHGSPLGEEETALMRQKLNWPYAPFEVLKAAQKAFQEAGLRSQREYEKWCQEADRAGDEFKNYVNDVLPASWNKDLNVLKEKAIAENLKVSTRQASQMCLEEIIKNVPQMVGGSADLAASNLTLTSYSKTITADDYNGNNIKYGIREHAMGAIMNGMSLHGGVIAFGGTFFVFSDYMRPAIRLAALMKIRSIFVMTHDSIGVGEDGPTHQPVEHLASFRAMPNVYMMRPCDLVETAECYEIAVQSVETPSVLALSRQGLPLLRKNAKENMCSYGGYIISDVEGKRDVTLISTGSEVSLCMKAQEILKDKGIDAAVVSMPCTLLFDRQSIKYRQSVLGTAPIIAVEAGATFGWHKYADDVIGMETFGASGKGEDIYQFFGLTVDEIVKRVEKTLEAK